MRRNHQLHFPENPALYYEARPANHLRMLSYNVQVGIRTEHYHHYITRAWQHILPSSARLKNLDSISALLKNFDLVALQEVDGGSFRSGFINQIEYLAEKAHHPYWYQQRNRNFGPLAQHSNGVLCKHKPIKVVQHELPGKIPGRGAIELVMGQVESPLTIIMVHLALGKRDQNQQLCYIRDLVCERANFILMGDLNVRAEKLVAHSALSGLSLYVPLHTRTYPSWKPTKALDHIVLSNHIKVHHLNALDHPVSDHLPVAIDFEWPHAG
ncbi:endonuclease/exonuclease/phosphatase family protein [Gynuella sunshinyii]|uniref:Metal-dependent hydrolase n=1 Tax=Gynuella sunshinyii YC6258 TaxID=1445510 RepID=A0A0C5VRD2_9GAMM|nr:endonuclease/exonuclease/phosphatase family protein [Gynuella sunshinyii]AJQ92789.1 metal-dependent hydrolase [Gynuella sunshinyii YC6258]